MIIAFSASMDISLNVASKAAQNTKKQEKQDCISLGTLIFYFFGSGFITLLPISTIGTKIFGVVIFQKSV